VLAATDPANPYGSSLSWPKRPEGRRPARTAGAYVLTRDGHPALYVERGGRGIVRLAELEGQELVDALAHLAAAARDGVIPKLSIERVDGEAAIGSPHEAALIEGAFARQPAAWSPRPENQLRRLSSGSASERCRPRSHRSCRPRGRPRSPAARCGPAGQADETGSACWKP